MSFVEVISGLYHLVFTKMNLPSASEIQGKTILITGANTGLGREAARHALSLGAGTIILGVRTLSKGEEAKADIEASTGTTDKSRVHVWPVDLESFQSVQAFATRVKAHVDEGGRLDIAIMNAGFASGEWAVTGDGWERGLQANVLSAALLSLLLLPLLLKTRERDPSARPHLTITASDIHRMIKFSERDEKPLLPVLNREDRWKESQKGFPAERYGVTKLLDIYIAAEIARLVPCDEPGNPLVVVDSFTPGFCKSDLLTREKAPLAMRIMQKLFARTIQEGSKTLLHAATQGVESHGKWLEHQAIADPGPLVTSPERIVAREKIWEEICAVLKGIDPEVCTEY